MKEHKRMERLMLFSQVAKELNFSRAAEHLGISRGHLSEQVKYLERELGTNLLNRSTRHVSLTQEGEKVLLCMDSIKTSLTAMERDINHQITELSGELKLTAPLLFAHRYLYDICDDFHQKNPGVTFSLNTSYQSFDLNKKDYDIAFRSTQKPPLDMVAKSLLTYQHSIVSAPSYLQKNGVPNSPQMLAKHQCLAVDNQALWMFKDVQVAVNGWLSLNDNFSILQQALDGRGIARLPNYFVEKYINDKKLVQLFTEEASINHQIYIIHPPKIQQSARLRAFLNHVTQWIKNN